MSFKVEYLEEANLAKCPRPTEATVAKEGSEWTFGDLHGSFTKLIYFLVSHGFIERDDKRYLFLLNFYHKKTEEVTEEDLDNFCSAIDSIKITQPKALVRLIGDIFADRGKNDYFTLILIEKLVKSGLKLEILLSNHDLEFIKLYENEGVLEIHQSVQGFFQSTVNLKRFIDKGLVTFDRILSIVETSYKPSLKLISYSLNDAKDEFVLYSHGKMGFETIRHLALKYNVEYDGSTAEKLSNTIDNINLAYSQIIVENKVSESYDLEAYGLASAFLPFDYKANPVVVVTQKRTYEGLTYPAQKNGYKIYYVHGHDITQPSFSHVFNLDNFFAKIVEILKGFYHVFCFHPSLDLTLDVEPSMAVSSFQSSSSTVLSLEPESKAELSVDELLSLLSQVYLEEDDESAQKTLDLEFRTLPKAFQKFWDTQTSKTRSGITALEHWQKADPREKEDALQKFALDC